MSDYTPSPNFDFYGQGAYTPAPDFVFVPEIVQARLLGVGLLGQPRLLGVSHFTGTILGESLLGAPRLVGAPRTLCQIDGVGLLGAPQVTAGFTYRAWLESPGLLGAPQLRGQPRTLAALLGPGLLGAPQARLWGLPATAVAIPPGITRFFCLLTGAPDGLADALLPISNFSVRHRPDAPSYYSITIPSYAYVGALTARPHGEIVIWSEKSGVSEELARGDLGQVAIARGPNSQSISISGNADRAELPHLTYVFDEALYVYTTFAGASRLRIEPRARIRPGDYVRYQDVNFAVGDVTWSVAVSAGGMAVTMELASVPLESGGAFYALAEARLMGEGLLGRPQAVASRTVDENELLSESITLTVQNSTALRQVALTPGTYEVHLLEGESDGDLDLYVRLDNADMSDPDCVSDSLTDEYCEVTTEANATLYIQVKAYGVPATNQLIVRRQLPPEIEVLPFAQEYPLTQQDPWVYSIAVVAGTYDVTLSAPDGTSGVDVILATRFDASPMQNADCDQYNPAAAVTCRVTTAAPALLYFLMYPMGAIPVTALITITAVPT